MFSLASMGKLRITRVSWISATSTTTILPYRCLPAAMLSLYRGGLGLGLGLGLEP